MVSEVDIRGDKYGVKKYLVQVFEPTLFATAICYAVGSHEEQMIEGATIGSYLTISGKVTSYGDVKGLQLTNCVVRDK